MNLKIHPKTRKIIREAIELDNKKRADGSMIYHGNTLFKLLTKKGMIVESKNNS